MIHANCDLIEEVVHGIEKSVLYIDTLLADTIEGEDQDLRNALDTIALNLQKLQKVRNAA